MVGPWGLEPQTWPTSRPALTNYSASNHFPNQSRRFPALDFRFSPSGFRQRRVFFAMHEFPWAAIPRRRRVVPSMFGYASFQICCGANVISAGRFTLKDICGCHQAYVVSAWPTKSARSNQLRELSGRPVGTRTPDLYRVKVAL